MKPAWDKLAKEFADSTTAGVFDVDCTAAGKPLCSPANIDLCDDDKKKEIETFQAMSSDELKAAIEAEEAKNEEAEKTFKSEVEKLQKKYESLQKDKEDAMKAVKDSGLGLMKAVAAHASA